MENQENRDGNNNQKGKGNNQSSQSKGEQQPRPGGQQSGVSSDQNTNWDKEQRDQQASPRDYNEPSKQGQESREKQKTSQEERDEEERTRQRAATQGGNNTQGHNQQIPKGEGGVEGDPGNLEGYGASQRQQSREKENRDLDQNKKEK
jgi:hypothetical protein